jgi:hypothetical protein
MYASRREPVHEAAEAAQRALEEEADQRVKDACGAAARPGSARSLTRQPARTNPAPIRESQP